MGLRTAPYQAVQGMLWAQEMILGDRRNKSNVFQWEKVKLNLPGAEDYDPSEPWVCKVRMDGVLAADIHIYVDDIRTTASSERECWKASQRVSSVLAYLGIQDAARKRREPGQGGGCVGRVCCAYSVRPGDPNGITREVGSDTRNFGLDARGD